MSVLDELRAHLVFLPQHYRDEAFYAIEAFEARHSGLTDLTGWEVEERKYGHGMEHIDAWRRRPACAKEAE